MRLLRAWQKPRISLTRNLSLDLLKTARAGQLGYRRPIEIPDFSSEAAAQYSIDAVSKKWLEKFAPSSNI
jgi:hypothetical protein